MRPLAPALVRDLARAAVCLVLAASPAAADPVDDLLAEARDACAGFEDGDFDPGDAVRKVDLDGEDPLDRIVDESRFACSSAASMYCGSGGCRLHAVIGDERWTWQATGWRMEHWGPSRILLIGRDGGWCGGAGAEVCFEAVTWSAGAPLTLGPPPDRP